jgi:hypothetical protein
LVATAFRDAITDPWSYKVYSYDPLGRVSTFYIYINKVWRTITNQYDHWGNLVKQNAAGLLYYFYDYDEQGRLKEIRSSIQDNKSTAVLEGIYSYNNTDQVSKFDLKNISGNNSFIDYLYNNRGWVDKISLNSVYPQINPTGLLKMVQIIIFPIITKGILQRTLYIILNCFHSTTGIFLLT